MLNAEEVVRSLTEEALTSPERRSALRQFAQIGGWRPSDELDEYPGTNDIANGHLVIEHGLDNAAVISFLRSTHPYDKLSADKQICLLEISYNNLVDWHLFPTANGMTVVYNRSDPPQSRYISKDEQTNIWRAETFNIITDLPYGWWALDE